MKFIIVSILIFAGYGSQYKNEQSDQPTSPVEIKLVDWDNFSEIQVAEVCNLHAPVK